MNFKTESLRKVTECLHDLGIPSNLKGFVYLRTVFCYAVEGKPLGPSITKDVYPSIAKDYNAKPPQVERCIRSAIQTGFSRGNLVMYEKLFGYSISSSKVYPSNSVFIATVTDYLTIL